MTESRRRRRKKKTEEKEEDIFEIDLNSLEEEWVKQPGLFFGYAKQLADAREKMDRLKASVDVAYAEADKQVREAPEEYGIEKITEGNVKAAVLTDDNYRAEREALTQAKHEVDILQAAVTALDHRKRALEKLVDLHGQEYFSTPRHKDMKEEEERARKRRRRQ